MILKRTKKNYHQTLHLIYSSVEFLGQFCVIQYGTKEMVVILECVCFSFLFFFQKLYFVFISKFVSIDAYKGQDLFFSLIFLFFFFLQASRQHPHTKLKTIIEDG